MAFVRVALQTRIGALALALACGSAGAACPPAGESIASLRALKAARWAAPADPQALALELLDCLASPEPLLRDELAFEALSAWMRGGRIDTRTLQTLRLRLSAVLQRPADAAGFEQPFAALALAEVARVDRLKPFLGDAEFESLVQAGARYLAQVRDYRGFDPAQGWRHGVAHGADLMLQLSLNPRLQRAQAETLRAAVAAQVMPAGDHAWRFGEPERLMAPIYHLARRDLFTPAEWQAWFEALAAQRTKAQPVTQALLAQRHNLGAFLNALYVAVQEQGPPEQRERLLPGLRLALRTLG